METTEIISKLIEFGPIIIIIIMYLEGLNLTGIPAIVIMPAIGVYISQSGHNFVYIYGIALVSSILGNLTYYIISNKLGGVIYDKIYDKFPIMRKSLDKSMSVTQKYGPKACFIGRLFPGARTFVSLVAGIFKVTFRDFIIYSSLGIAIWNFVLIFLGYFFSNLA